MHIVSNPSADRPEKIEHAAKILRVSKQAKEVFRLVYTGGKQCKTIDDMRAGIRGFNNNTYAAANRLAAEDIVEKRTVKGRDYYCKIPFYTHNRNHILRLSENKNRLKTFNTKRSILSKESKIFSFSHRPQTELLHIDQIESFKRVKKVKEGDKEGVKKMPERVINTGICLILNQSEKKDWGGEKNDIFTTRTVLKSKRVAAAFALKGRGTKGTLVPGKMGKNGDQISRLFSSPAEVYFVLHNDLIDESIFELVKTYATAKSIETGKKIYYCIIDGQDLARLVVAYPDKFNSK